MMTKHDPNSVLAPDSLPWERQPGETEQAYAAFHAWLHSEKRKVTDHGPTAKSWSAQWHWSSRAHEYDLYMSRVDLEDQVRYRRKMNARHRQVASVAQGKFVEWLNGLTADKVVGMSVTEATRLLDVAVRIEREATGAVGLEDLPAPFDEPAREGTLEQRIIEAGLDVDLSELANVLHGLDRDPPARVSERQAQTSAPRPPQIGA